MLTINNIPILVPVQTIIMELNMQLKLQGKSYLTNMKQSGDDILCSCPFHGEDKHPSFGILVHDKNDTPAGTYNCLACKEHGTLSTLISKLLYDKSDDAGTYGDRYLLDNYADYELDNRETAFKLPCREKSIEHATYISEEELDRYAYTHPYITNTRGIAENIIDLFDVGYDANFRLNDKCNVLPTITFPVKDVDSNCLFVARRAIHNKLYWYNKDVEKPLYGIYELSHVANWETKTIYITESIINCLSLWSAGVYAIALNGTGNQKQIEAIKRLPNRNIILALDTGDNAGLNGTHKLLEALKQDKILSWLKMPCKTDINDLWVRDKTNFLERISKFIVKNY